ncbi:hypothetical protein FGO68_gene1606 [Halteria grandinella]|uniref:Uncharacterized protein n=1 Tax=Halteria grandinella TaxID=5974 RepID=A0A8J8P5S0_HALGN|nr:hypothetical protein FGO68_gene1606 [Halteria grandinella]
MRTQNYRQGYSARRTIVKQRITHFRRTNRYQYLTIETTLIPSISGLYQDKSFSLLRMTLKDIRLNISTTIIVAERMQLTVNPIEPFTIMESEQAATLMTLEINRGQNCQIMNLIVPPQSTLVLRNQCAMLALNFINYANPYMLLDDLRKLTNPVEISKTTCIIKKTLEEPKLNRSNLDPNPFSSTNTFKGESESSSSSESVLVRSGASHLSVMRQSMQMNWMINDYIGEVMPGIAIEIIERDMMKVMSFIMPHISSIANPLNNSQ